MVSPKTNMTDAKEHSAALRLQADRAFKKAAKAAVAENSRLGIATHGAVRGKLVVGAPSKRRKPTIA